MVWSEELLVEEEIDMDKMSAKTYWMYCAGLLAGHGIAVEFLNHIDKLLEAEEQGLLLKLPCKVGDVVYEFVEKIGKKGHWEEDKYFVDEWEINIIRERGFDLYMLASGEFGKTVFLTEQEAQAALEKMKGE